MAKADINVEFVLTLTEDEAIVLRDIVSNIAGFPGTRRDLVNNISDALDNIGMAFDADSAGNDIEGTITFIHTED
jgi:hypothetical protein